jgi:hypothetical protein
MASSSRTVEKTVGVDRVIGLASETNHPGKTSNSVEAHTLSREQPGTLRFSCKPLRSLVGSLQTGVHRADNPADNGFSQEKRDQNRSRQHSGYRRKSR